MNDSLLTCGSAGPMNPAPLQEVPLSAQSQGAATKPAELWLSIDLPRLAVDAVAADRSQPAAIVQQSTGRAEIFNCNHAARLGGIGPDMPLAAALSLRQDLKLYPRQQDAERRELIRLADWALTFSDRIALYTGHTVMIAIRGSLRLFGGMSALMQRILSGLEDFGPDFAVAVAPSPRAAFWLAQSSNGSIVRHVEELVPLVRDFPVSMVARDARHLLRLQRSGIHTLADLMRLPRAGVARRFGARTLELLDLTLGRKDEILNPYDPAPVFSAQRTFYLPTGDLNLIRPAAKALLEDFVRYLKGRHLATRRFCCELRRDAEAVARIEVGCRRPAREITPLRVLLEEHLSRVQLQADATSIRIECSEFEEAIVEQIDLFDTRPAEFHSWFGLIEQLQARLGKAALKQLAVREDHRPECAFLNQAGQNKKAMSHVAGRPLWLLQKPQLLDLRRNRPCWRGALDRLTRYERIEQGWWDGFDVRRDYCVAENPAGSRLWIYRDHRDGKWFLHGVFA